MSFLLLLLNLYFHEFLWFITGYGITILIVIIAAELILLL